MRKDRTQGRWAAFIRSFPAMSPRLARHLPSAAGLFLLGVPILIYLTRDNGQIARLGFRPHAPKLDLLAAAPTAIQVHVAAALTALAIGIVLLIGVKGTRLHRTLGWAWVAAMGTTAISSFFIHAINPGGPAGLSLIHLLSGWTVVGLPMAVYAARRHRVQAHRRAMTSMFVGGLIVAGLLTFLPGRLMWAVFFS
ncbi:hypothetical protein GCM10010203_65650 [Actinomadura yumaensis]